MSKIGDSWGVHSINSLIPQASLRVEEEEKGARAFPGCLQSPQDRKITIESSKGLLFALLCWAALAEIIGAMSHFPASCFLTAQSPQSWAVLSIP